jgi:hypothetical protein
VSSLLTECAETATVIYVTYLVMAPA